METFSASLALCAENSPVTGEFSAQRPVTWIFSLIYTWTNGKQSRRRWIETPSRSLWRHCNVTPEHGKAFALLATCDGWPSPIRASNAELWPMKTHSTLLALCQGNPDTPRDTIGFEVRITLNKCLHNFIYFTHFNTVTLNVGVVWLYMWNHTKTCYHSCLTHCGLATRYDIIDKGKMFWRL